MDKQAEILKYNWKKHAKFTKIINKGTGLT